MKKRSRPLKLYNNLDFLASCKESYWNEEYVREVRENEFILPTLRIEYKNILANIFDEELSELLRIDYCRLISKRGYFYWMKRGLTFEESCLKISEIQNTISLTSFQVRYGSREGWYRYRHYVRKRLWTISQWSEEYKKEVNNKKKPKNPSFGIYVSEDDDYSFRDSSSKEYFMRKFGAVEGLKRYREKVEKCSGTLENFQRIYGEEEGFIRWKQKTENWLDILNSKTSEEKEFIDLKKSHSIEGIMEVMLMMKLW